jgi:SAM-dependent methyltransferase
VDDRRHAVPPTPAVVVAYRGAMTQEHARSFGPAARHYDTYRPSYAPDALVAALGERALRVADVGAGTGILSRQLRGLGHDVVAVEPDDLMRARLVEVSPDIAALAGTAEALPLPDASVDAVVAGQAYHWFDVERAHPEIARVLRPGGVLAVVRNDADPAVEWTVRFAEIIDGVATSDEESAVDFGPLFEPVALALFHHEVWLGPDDLVALASTRSPYLVASAAERERLVGAVRGLIEEAGLADRFAMPYVTRVYRARRR